MCYCNDDTHRQPLYMVSGSGHRKMLQPCVQSASKCLCNKAEVKTVCQGNISQSRSGTELQR